MAVTSENNKFIASLLTFSLADAIKKADINKLHIDDAQFTVATHAVVLNYKAIEGSDLKRIMGPLQRFFKRDPLVYGHRSDYFLCSRSIEPHRTRSEILKDCRASANNPILLEFSY